MVSRLKKNSAEWFIEQINVENAKLLAFALVIGFIGYHGLLHLMYGPDSCTWLLMSGRYKGDHEWQPYGCMLHIYSKKDARRCLRYLAFWGKYNNFAFIGDSRIEQLYDYFIGVLKTKTEMDTSYSTIDHRTPNYTYIDTKLRLSVSFVWSNDISKTMVEQFRSWQSSDKPPSVIVAGTGLQLIRSRNATDPVLEEYKRNLTHLVQAIDSLAARHTQVLWKLVESVDTSRMKQPFVNNVDIDAYNAAAVEILTHSAAKIWNSPRLIVSGAYSEDGVSLSQTALRHSAQVVLNMFCNEQMNFGDGSCCAPPETANTRQLLLAAAAIVCAVLSIIKYLVHCSRRLQNGVQGYSLVNTNDNSEPSVLMALAKLGVIIAYFYLCDRTNFFMKENKYYSEWSFWLPVGYVFALGLFFTEESKSSRVLHREQTDEWKGWMQLVFLISQVTGATKVLPIYMLVRVLASSYLFLSGYGHVTYTSRRGDASLARWARVMFRLNFVPAVLCVAMNRPYQFYGFVPLVSFGYTLMWVVLWAPPLWSPGSLHTLALVVRILSLLAVLTVLYMSEVFFQKIFVARPWKALFVNADDDIGQWWLRWKQDRYSMAGGMSLALVCLLAQRHNLFEDCPHGPPPSPPRAAISVLLALISISGYVTFTFLCTNTYDCNEIHSYVAFVPIVGYVVLRNVSGALRTRHSSMFAWFGNFTLELFVSHSHIWLAADTQGILVLIPGAPGLNLILTSYIFVCVAHEVHKLTMVILPHAVPNDWKLVLRNLTIFCIVLLSLGIRDGF